MVNVSVKSLRDMEFLEFVDEKLHNKFLFIRQVYCKLCVHIHVSINSSAICRRIF